MNDEPEKMEPEELKATMELVRMQASTIIKNCNDQCVGAGLLPLLEDQTQVCGAVIFAHLLCVMGITVEDIRAAHGSELPLDKKKKK